MLMLTKIWAVFATTLPVVADKSTLARCALAALNCPFIPSWRIASQLYCFNDLKPIRSAYWATNGHAFSVVEL